ncbi:hypothetical protein V6N13_043102 [Hibiscus sabdariffa]
MDHKKELTNVTFSLAHHFSLIRLYIEVPILQENDVCLESFPFSQEKWLWPWKLRKLGGHGAKGSNRLAKRPTISMSCNSAYRKPC